MTRTHWLACAATGLYWAVLAMLFALKAGHWVALLLWLLPLLGIALGLYVGAQWRSTLPWLSAAAFLPPLIGFVQVALMPEHLDGTSMAFTFMSIWLVAAAFLQLLPIVLLVPLIQWLHRRYQRG